MPSLVIRPSTCEFGRDSNIPSMEGPLCRVRLWRYLVVFWWLYIPTKSFKHFNFIYLFLDRGEGEREGEKHQWVAASLMPPTGDLACNPGMCPGWESNWQPFGSQAWAQSTELHQPGLYFIFEKNLMSPHLPITQVSTFNSRPISLYFYLYPLLLTPSFWSKS